MQDLLDGASRLTERPQSGLHVGLAKLDVKEGAEST